MIIEFEFAECDIFSMCVPFFILDWIIFSQITTIQTLCKRWIFRTTKKKKTTEFFELMTMDWWTFDMKLICSFISFLSCCQMNVTCFFFCYVFDCFLSNLVLVNNFVSMDWINLLFESKWTLSFGEHNFNILNKFIW